MADEGSIQETLTAAEQAAAEAEQQATDTGTGAGDDEAAQAAAAAQAAEEEARAKAARSPEGYVPHQALHAERERRKDLERRLEALEHRTTAAPEKEPEYVDPIVDPEGFRKWTEHQNGKLAKSQETQTQQAQDQVKAMQRRAKAMAEEQAFVQTVPDYTEASQWLLMKRGNELVMSGLSQSEVQDHVVKEMEAISTAAETMGTTFPALVFMKAQQEGWKKGDGAGAGPSEADKLKALAEAQKATETLGNRSGGQQAGALTLEAIGKMSEAEIAKLPEEDFERLMA